MIQVPVGVEQQRRLVWQEGEGSVKISAEATVNQDGLGSSQPCEVAAWKEPGSEIQPVGQAYGSHLFPSATTGSMQHRERGRADRSEERRVGKECRSRWMTSDYREN